MPKSIDFSNLKGFCKFVEQEYSPLLAQVRSDRPYRIPKDFIDWETLSALLVGATEMRDKVSDLASRLHSYRVALWLVQDAPLYCLSKELYESLVQTDILSNSELLKDLKLALPSLLILLPKGLVKSPDGGHLDYVSVHLSSASRPELSTGERWGIKLPYLQHKFENNIHWAAVDSQQTCWFSGCGLQADGSIADEKEDLGTTPMTPGDYQFTLDLRNLVLQILLILTYQPELVEAVTITEGRRQHSKGFRPTSQEENQARYPRWLGKNYKSKVERKTSGTHASPVSHWRKGHWKRVVYGQGRTERRLTWIAPVRVVGS